jgi:hypothetical protein
MLSVTLLYVGRLSKRNLSHLHQIDYFISTKILTFTRINDGILIIISITLVTKKISFVNIVNNQILMMPNVLVYLKE